MTTTATIMAPLTVALVVAYVRARPQVRRCYEASVKVLAEAANKR